MTNYNELDQFLGKKEDRPYGNNTRVHRTGKTQIAIKHFETDIMLFTENLIMIDCQGWRSYTTKERINNNLPKGYGLYQKHNQWYLWDREKDESLVYEDGITINTLTNKVTGMGKLSDVKKRQKLIRQINKYANDFVTEFVVGNIPEPSGGDCFYCHFDSIGGREDHLLSHIEEKYYVPSLLLNAINEFSISPMASWVIGEKWQEGEKVEFAYDTFKDQAKKSIVKYIKRQIKL